MQYYVKQMTIAWLFQYGSDIDPSSLNFARQVSQQFHGLFSNLWPMYFVFLHKRRGLYNLNLYLSPNIQAFKSHKHFLTCYVDLKCEVMHHGEVFPPYMLPEDEPGLYTHFTTGMWW